YKQTAYSGEMKPYTKWDADLYNGKVNYRLNESSNIRDSLNLSKFATGGHISAGNSGIIAEAGPELIEVMNGGVRITPMREKARNTEVSDNTAGQKIFYNTYNLNNPRVSNDMDIRQIAQKLAIEQRRIERGRGIF
ncbi:MAG: hypothetical protein K2G83_02610, partial [Ruminococcus sp.]|nr:hypothetical protein [Ruminococcus sp.]